MDSLEEDCAICGLALSEKYPHKLDCGHSFHYECLMKSFGNYNVEKNRNCPYCRKKTNYLPLIYGLKKIIPGIHCSFYELKDKKEELKEYQIKCNHVLTRGKRKHEQCGKNCKLGYQQCGLHHKSQIKFDKKVNVIKVKKQTIKENGNQAEEKAPKVSQ